MKQTRIMYGLLAILIACLVVSACTAAGGSKTAASGTEGPQHTGSSQGKTGGGAAQVTPAATPAPAVTSGNGASVPANVPASPLLGRPTDRSVNINLIPSGTFSGFIEYRNASLGTAIRTAAIPFENGIPANVVLDGLAPDTEYQYRVCTGTSCGPEYSFHTWRPPGSSFVFDIQADSHLDDRTSGDLYRQAIRNELNDTPDFLIDLGDTSMTEKQTRKTAEVFRDRYLLQRSYLDAVGSSTPVFLVLGNHDGEAGYEYSSSAGTIGALSLQLRKQFFQNPEPDGFYTGNTESRQSLGSLEDYYAWQWGDALFVVIDPFWYTTTKPGGKMDAWGWTLGKTQYQWLRDTLETSNAKYTFVFSHHLVGGDSQGRGGVEYAGLYEWGGKNPDGSQGFDQHRPGWGVPIHQMLVENNVSAFFHGHDHLYAQQDLDGIVYQEVPQPATVGSPDSGKEYGYVKGVVLPSPGHLKITVSPDSARVDYTRSALSGDRKTQGQNGEIVYSYTISPRGSGIP